MNKKHFLNEVNDIISSKYIYMACASFEDRCFSIASNLNIDNIISAYVFFYEEFQCFSENNRAKLKEIFGIEQLYMLSNSNPIVTADVMYSVFNKISATDDKPDLVIDITTFTREGLLIIFKIATIFKEKFKNTYFVYNCAAKMQSEQLSFGAKEFRSVLGYSGLLSPLKKNHLVLLMGFEVERARLIINQYEPHLISIGVGSHDNSISEELYKKNQRFLDELKSYYTNKPLVFNLSLVDPFIAFKDIASHISKFTDCNTIIAPMNTKLSTVGAGFYAQAQENTQICYLQMDSYSYDDYSSPSDEFYIYKIF